MVKVNCRMSLGTSGPSDKNTYCFVCFPPGSYPGSGTWPGPVLSVFSMYRQFPQNLLFGQVEFSLNREFWGVKTKYFPNSPFSRT